MTVDEENFLCGLKLVLMNIRLESPRRKAGRKLAVKHLHNHNMAKHTLGGGGGGEKKRRERNGKLKEGSLPYYLQDCYLRWKFIKENRKVRKKEA